VPSFSKSRRKAERSAREGPLFSVALLIELPGIRINPGENGKAGKCSLGSSSNLWVFQTWSSNKSRVRIRVRVQASVKTGRLTALRL